ncbi:MAG TPA: CsbD family protein [Steroidobacteraceae bacterium]|nr:CsbD family protein [Steroidobacteraceae bacterium]
MNKDQVKGAAREVGGKLQKNAGRATGSTEQEVKGTAREIAGKAQKAYGDAKSDVNDRRGH